MQLEKGASKKQFLKNGLEWNLIKKKIQETTPTNLDQLTEGQTLIQRIDCSKDTVLELPQMNEREQRPFEWIDGGFYFCCCCRQTLESWRFLCEVF